MAATHATFPDIAVTVHDQVAEEDKVVTRWSATGTHTGSFAGVAATGRSITVTGIHIHRVQDGRLVEHWEELDRFRGTVPPDGSGWAFTVGPTWMRDASMAASDDVKVELEPEGPQRGDLAGDIRAALEASPAAAAFSDTLAQFYRKAFLRWIDAATRRPDLRAARITEVVHLLATGIKERPRS